MHSDDEDYMPKLYDIKRLGNVQPREHTVEEGTLLPAMNILN